MLDCSCNGNADILGKGGECTDGKNRRWCYVNKDACNKRNIHDGKFFSTTPCKSEAQVFKADPNKPCACNGKSDKHGHGGSCDDDDYCFVDKDANCADIKPYDGKTFSKDACKGKEDIFNLIQSPTQESIIT